MSTKNSAQVLESVSKMFPWADSMYTCRIYMSRKIVATMVIDGHSFLVGWMHNPAIMPLNRYALGIFTDKQKSHFIPIALANTDGEIYETSKLRADLNELESRVYVGVEGEGRVKISRFMRTKPSASNSSVINIKHGAVIARSENGRARWLASFLKQGNRYTFEQVRSSILTAADLANNREKDAMVIAYFMIYAQPTLALDNPRVLGFGTSNIYRRLRQQAPLSAIRMSNADIDDVRSAGLRVSGLEEYFCHAMKESGALERIPHLEAKHGQENLETETNPRSHLYYLHSRDGVDFDAAVKTLRIESNLNRFVTTASVIENNYHFDFLPTEDSIHVSYVAQLSEDLLENPAFDALSTLDTHGVEDVKAYPALWYTRDKNQTSVPESSFTSRWLGQFYAQAREKITDPQQYTVLNNIPRINAVYPMVRAARETAFGIAMHNDPYRNLAQTQQNHGAHNSQWVYRQALSRLITYLRLPLRSDIDFRADVEKARATVIDFTSTASTGMPLQRFDSASQTWVDLSDTERAQMSSRYNLRVGIILAALAFGASDNIDKVAIRIDSLDSTQDLEDRDPTMYALLMRALEKMGMDNQSPSSSSNAPSKEQLHSNSQAPGHTRSTDTQNTSGAQNSSGTQTDNAVLNAESNTASSDNDAFFDIMNSANFSDDQINAFESYNSQPTDAEVDEVFNAVTSANDDSAGENHSGESQNDESNSPVKITSAPGTDPLELIRRTALNNTVAAVVFERQHFMEILREYGLTKPYDFYREFETCTISPNADGVLQPIETSIDIRDTFFSPEGSQDEPEISRAVLSDETADMLGTHTAQGLSIQRSDILERAQEDIAAFAQETDLSVPQKAQKISEYIDSINDPELNEYKESYLRSVIDGTAIDRNRFTLSNELDNVREKSRETFLKGNAEEALTMLEDHLEILDAKFRSGDRVPVYFNSYPERVVYNKLRASSQENLVLIPDNLFRAHMELVEVYSQLGQRDKALKHVNMAVSYAPVYAFPHLRLSVMLAEDEDWKSSFAAAHNALLVALDKDDAAYAYYRMAYAAWMQDEFSTAAACYIISIGISERAVPHAREELNELSSRARSQDIALPDSADEAADALMYFGIDLWPFTDAVQLMTPSAKAAVDSNLFVAARALNIAAINLVPITQNLDENDAEALYIVQSQFLRSLNA
ncbi:tetratricopeptide repeat protein [Alloscardovia theropitheci]|uniref:Tetratricopeptide repeat protein n=1 Tax=Alloscardovia theropitheci TaxID=2496842 RepID=A0A4R0QWG6_9BIFI|nr:tetratricopeptide repeat protein [Alloscardovia theropitheci]TCD53601.1 tetratricopeptide repeat protein [Alloscardovia theropitheci]